MHYQYLLSLKVDDTIFILSIYEFEYALANAPEHKKAEIENIIQQIQQDFIVLPLSLTEARLFANLKMSLKTLRNINQANLSKHTIDLMIAASALNNNAILVSADKLFNDICLFDSTFKLENWTLSS